MTITSLKNIKEALSKMKERISSIFDLPSLDLEPETEEEVSDEIVQKITRFGMELPAILFGSPLIPTCIWVSQMVVVPAAPVLEFLGIEGYKYAAFLNNRKNVTDLIKRLEKLQKNKGKNK